MKLNPDCVRDILLTVEENTSFCSGINFLYQQNNLENNESNNYSSTNRLDRYSNDEIMYHVRQCELNGFFIGTSWDLSGNCDIKDLSPAGHEFLANIRADTNWSKVKQKAKAVGSESLNVLSQIAGQVISAMLTQSH